MCPHILSHDGPSACMLHIRAEICRNQETRIYPCSTRCRFAPVSLASLHAWWLMAQLTHWPEVNLAGGMPGHIGPLNGLAPDRACMLCLCLLGETLQWRHVDWRSTHSMGVGLRELPAAGGTICRIQASLVHHGIAPL